MDMTSVSHYLNCLNSLNSPEYAQRRHRRSPSRAAKRPNSRPRASPFLSPRWFLAPQPSLVFGLKLPQSPTVTVTTLGSPSLFGNSPTKRQRRPSWRFCGEKELGAIARNHSVLLETPKKGQIVGLGGFGGGVGGGWGGLGGVGGVGWLEGVGGVGVVLGGLGGLGFGGVLGGFWGGFGGDGSEICRAEIWPWAFQNPNRTPSEHPK